MENTLVVLLLICALSSAEEAKSEDQPQHYPSDLLTVLQHMTETMTQNKLKIEHLETYNQELVAKLKELEDKDNGVGPIKDQLKEQAAKLKELEQQTNEVAKTKEQLQERQVAFSASHFISDARPIGPYGKHTGLIFRNIITNIGNAYSASTGFFTAPVKGAYHFELYVYGLMDSKHPSSAAVIVKDGVRQVIAYEHQPGGGSASTGVTLVLEKGNIVSVQLWAHSRIYDNHNHHCVFNGHLLFTMEESNEEE